jgi:hypothetical protein
MRTHDLPLPHPEGGEGIGRERSATSDQLPQQTLQYHATDLRGRTGARHFGHVFPVRLPARAS